MCSCYSLHLTHPLLPPSHLVHKSVLYVCISIQFSRSVMSDSLRPHGLQHARPPCPSPTPGACSNSCPLSQWYYPTISSSVVPFSSCFQSFPALGSFPMSQFLASGGQSIRASASASVLPLNIQGWFPLRLTGWISFQSNGLSRVFSSSVTQSCPTLCNPMNHSTPGFPVHHQLPELAQTHVHLVGDTIQPSHPLSPPSLPAFNLSQH